MLKGGAGAGFRAMPAPARQGVRANRCRSQGPMPRPRMALSDCRRAHAAASKKSFAVTFPEVASMIWAMIRESGTRPFK